MEKVNSKKSFSSIAFLRSHFLASSILFGALLISLSFLINPPSDYHRYKLLDNGKVFDTQTGLSITVYEGETFEDAAKRTEEENREFERQRAIETANQEAAEKAKPDSQRKAEQEAKERAELQSNIKALSLAKTNVWYIKLIEEKLQTEKDVHQREALMGMLEEFRKELPSDPNAISKLEADVGPEYVATVQGAIEQNLDKLSDMLDQEIEKLAETKRREAQMAELREKYESKRQELGLKMLESLDKLP